jgi:hypothetical protein
MSKDIDSSNPWDWMQPHDARLLGDVIRDPQEQGRWCRAVMLGGLPYMWRRKAAVVRELMYEKLALRRGDAVLIVGESIESCGFADDIRARIGEQGTIETIDITSEAREAYFAGRRGRHGQLATWRWDYTRAMAEERFDCVAVLQATQHADDWTDVGRELLRVMKRGRNILLSEITMSPQMVMKAGLDVHIEYWLEKMFAGVGFNIDQIPYYAPQELMEAFKGLVSDAATFEWKGVELFWGTKI